MVKYSLPPTVNTIVYQLVVSELATYYELKYKYSEWDILDLLEILAVKRNNEEIYKYNCKMARK